MYHPKRFLRRFGLKTGIDFAHFGLESSMVFEGTMGVYVRILRWRNKTGSQNPKTESQNPKQNRKIQNRTTKRKTESQNPKQNHKTVKQNRKTQNKITKP